MQLPDIKPRVIPLTLGGVKLNFREITVEDMDFILQQTQTNDEEIKRNSTLRLYARLLHGYEATEDQAFELLRKLPISATKEMSDSLHKLGMKEGENNDTPSDGKIVLTDKERQKKIIKASGTR